MKDTFTAYPYPGGNATIDRLHDGTSDIWIVNGANGRQVMLLPLGTTKKEAKAAYLARWGRKWRGTGNK